MTSNVTHPRHGATLAAMHAVSHSNAEFEVIRRIAERARRQVEEHDPYTRDHSMRVACLARQLAALLPSFNRDRINRLEITALLHDYGKVDVPLEILNFPGRLDEKSLAEVRLHPEHGIKRVSILEDYVELGGILWHHKYFDGGGYPAGDLVGHAIPLEARIIAVADVFDAMTSPRIYHPGRTGKTSQQALQEMRRVSGSQLDPTLVKMFEVFVATQISNQRGSVGFNTIQLMSALAADIQRARKYLTEKLGSHDQREPLRDVQDKTAFCQEMMDHLRGLHHSEQSLRNIVNYVCGLELKETFPPEEIEDPPDQLPDGASTTGQHHIRTNLRLKRQIPDLEYMSVVVHRGMLWLCVGESHGATCEITLIR